MPQDVRGEIRTSQQRDIVPVHVAVHAQGRVRARSVIGANMVGDAVTSACPVVLCVLCIVFGHEVLLLLLLLAVVVVASHVG